MQKDGGSQRRVVFERIMVSDPCERFPQIQFVCNTEPFDDVRRRYTLTNPAAYGMIYEIKSETEAPIEIDITVSAASLTAEHEQIRKCKGQINIEK